MAIIISKEYVLRNHVFGIANNFGGENDKTVHISYFHH